VKGGWQGGWRSMENRTRTSQPHPRRMSINSPTWGALDDTSSIKSMKEILSSGSQSATLKLFILFINNPITSLQRFISNIDRNNFLPTTRYDTYLAVRRGISTDLWRIWFRRGEYQRRRRGGLPPLPSPASSLPQTSCTPGRKRLR
jgi:hypothetical protein